MNKAKHIIRIAVLTLFSVFVLTLLFAGFYSIFPPNCERCHVGPKAKKDIRITPSHSAHKDTACIKCHAGKGVVSRAAFGAQVAYGMVAPVFSQANFDADSSYDSKCKSCHIKLSGVSLNNGIRINHDKCATESSCVSCHGNSGHTVNDSATNVTYTMDECFSCHKEISSDKKCSLCHVGRSSQAIKSTSSWQITHGPNWKKTHGMGNLDTCSVCHADSMCAKCHGVGVPHKKDFFSEHGKYGQSKGQNCITCHATTFCSDCHGGYEMPHPKDFIRTHVDVAQTNDDPSCSICHNETDCTNCHSKHIHPGGAKTSYQRAKGGN